MQLISWQYIEGFKFMVYNLISEGTIFMKKNYILSNFARIIP